MGVVAEFALGTLFDELVQTWDIRMPDPRWRGHHAVKIKLNRLTLVFGLALTALGRLAALG